MAAAVQQCRHAATCNAFSAATPERIVAAKRFMGKLDKLYKVCFPYHSYFGISVAD